METRSGAALADHRIGMDCEVGGPNSGEVALPEFVALPEDALDVARSGKQASMSPGARQYRPVLSRFAAVVSIGVAACLPAAGATAQWYVGICGNASRDVVMESRSNDRASICDEYINPRALSVAGCTTVGRGAGDGWLARFDPGGGFSGEAELGVRLSPRLRLAAVYARSGTDFDQTVSSTDATGADFDKIRNELSVGEETLGSANSDEFRIVAYHDWPNRSRWTPYAGAGVAVSRTRKDFAWLWARCQCRVKIPQKCRSKIPQFETSVHGHASVFRCLFPGGRPRRLGAGGGEPVSAWSRTRDTARFSALFATRYAMP